MMPSLLKSERFGPYGNALLYFKGPYLLYELENKIGQDNFIEFLMNLNDKKVSNTSELLFELEKVTSKKTKEEFEEKLNN